MKKSLLVMLMAVAAVVCFGISATAGPKSKACTMCHADGKKDGNPSAVEKSKTIDEFKGLSVGHKKATPELLTKEGIKHPF